MKSPVAFLVPVLGCMLGCMLLSGTLSAADGVGRQPPVESLLSQDNQRKRETSPSQMTQQESISADSAGDSMPKENSLQQLEAKKLEVELRKLLLLSCPR